MVLHTSGTKLGVAVLLMLTVALGERDRVGVCVDVLDGVRVMVGVSGTGRSDCCAAGMRSRMAPDTALLEAVTDHPL